uniref:Uncharacterized protein n=1 Tax=Oryza meridionalis TaxID=40149 RepID=A0A0E0E5L8_9ORYZ
MAYYALFVEVVEMEGIIRLQPVRGFDATATAYFFACKNCSALGSVALLPGYGKPLDSMGEKGLAMILKISGYVPIDCHMVCDWIVTKVSGESFHVNDAGSRVYGTDGKEVVNLNKLKFSVNKIKKFDLP